MAIEQMTFIDIKGSEDDLDEVLIRCARCGIFQPESAANLSEYSIGTSVLLRNPYGALHVKIGEIAAQLGITLEQRDPGGCTDSQPSPDSYIEQTHAYLNRLRDEYPQYFEQQKRLSDEIMSYSTALEMLRHVDAPDINFDQLWENRFLKIRFGRLPDVNVPKLEVQDGQPCEIYKLDASMGWTWCMYVTAREFSRDVDRMFHSLGFERLRIPDYVHGTATDAISFIQEGLAQEREQLQATAQDIQAFVDRERDQFLEVYTRVKFLYEAYNLRKYAVVIRDQFHVIGFVLTRDHEDFIDLFQNLPSVVIEGHPAAPDGPIPVPVKLRNNWFVRPFEMFVNMYGSPSYNDIDPSPFVAYTYCLLFGMMFGDLGHGLCVFLLGLFLTHKRGMALGGIMSRIGVTSMVFGFAYGSVFGFEHLLDPVFRMMGFDEKPIHVMDPDTTTLILVAAIAVGVALIIMVILFNIGLGIKHRDISRALLSSNGAAGLVFYTAVLTGAVRMLLTGAEVFTAPYVLCLIVLPLLVMFFREPITHYIQYLSKGQIIQSDEDLKSAAQFKEGGVNIPELFTTKFVTARFGRLPVDSYRKLHFYHDKLFMFYPLKTDHEYIWCIYAVAMVNKQEIDAIFHDLLFERIYIPQDQLETPEMAEAFIKRCVDTGGLPLDMAEATKTEKYGDVPIEQPKTLYRTLFPDGIGSFVAETFFELFEVVLSFISNTMSFLRVGGFILVHAGMMEVVFQLSEMVGSGASPVILIIGNVFVMAMEGLIVGIQALRLEFYEIFSRFFNATGETFTPYRVSYGNPPPAA